MHPCLKIPELVAPICSHLLPPPKSFDLWISAHEPTCPHQCHLAVLARTSTVFSSHALRLLWKSVPLIRLLFCLPSETYRLSYTKYHPKYIDSMTPRRSLKESDLEHLALYSQHVQYLFAFSLDADASAMFSSLRPWLSEKQFPLLRGISWGYEGGDFNFIDSFISPRITTLKISEDSPAASMLVSSIATRCPELTYLSCSNRTTSDAKASPVWECVRGLGRIRALHTELLDRDTFEHLSRLPSFEELSLIRLPADLPPPDTQPFFPQLAKLHLQDFDSAMRFFERGDHDQFPLAEFSLEMASAFSTADVVHQLLSVAAPKIIDSSLKEFIFGVGFGILEDSDRPNHVIRSSSLRLLLPFRNLTTVSFLSAAGVDLDDTTITDMARSWPHIERLQFESYFGTSRPRATLRSLEAFAQYCPHLTELTITFDATEIPPSQGEFRLEGLTRFHVEASPITTVRPVAEFISRVFPGLTSVGTLADILDDDEGWEENLVPEAFEYDVLWKKVEKALERYAERRQVS
ncbi:hypothetical protein FB45DRAFT_803165 [Roridomyces roridus]|uniref:F-box domain-containing protein n=1 Tax=Roridomyces roridus TaxID=1738132 RepID=A0AAD7B6Y4_9AGAR|nr:hypothetical protein FB45DRAFT_803165 [Roridomyces roridus]